MNIRLLMLAFITFGAREYALWCINDSLRQAKMIVYGTYPRPYVYRALIPWVARYLNELGFREDVAVIIAIIASAIGLVYAIQYLLSSFQKQNDTRVFLISALVTLAFMILFSRDCKVYDLATAAFFALGIGAMKRNSLGLFYILFILSSINRETTIVLTIIFSIYFFKRMRITPFLLGIGFQVLTFILIRIWLTMLFKDNIGVHGVIRPLENLRLYTYYPLITFIHWMIIILIIWQIVRKRRTTPQILNLSFFILFPLLMGVYIVAGFSFEVRIFAEVYPIAFSILWLPNDRAIIENTIIKSDITN